MQKRSLKENKIRLEPRIKPFLQSFARRKSRAFSDLQQKLMDNVYPSIRIEEDVSNYNELVKGWDKKFLEIGFGGGEHLSHQASNNPKNLYIGAEVFLNGVAACLQESERKAINNIIYYDQDSRILLKNMPEMSIDGVYILFADPWPKKRHQKRRIVNIETLTLLHRVIKDKAFIRLATDHAEYFEWMVNVCRSQDLFDYEIIAQPADHIVTRYQQKGLDEGRDSQFLELRKK